MITATGIPTQKDLERVLPPPERLAKGPCVIVECFQKIPCDPCVDACPGGVISIQGNINNLPVIDYEKCTGCGVCISACPGLAIFVIDKKKGIVMLPYEFIPVPEKGNIVDGLNRRGEKVCDAEVIKVINTKKQDRTAIIHIQVPKELVMEVRNIT